MGKKIFKIFSIIFLLACICFYGYRLVHYYKVFNTKEEVTTYTYLHKKIINNSYINGDLLKNDEEYIYNSKYTNNYVKYSGLLWQIISISLDGEIKMVSKDNLLVLANSSKEDKSIIYEYLNDKATPLYRNLEAADAYLSNTKVCTDIIEDVDNPTCDKSEDYLIGILSINDYILTGGSDGFVKAQYSYWLSNMKDENRYYYVNEEGKIKSTKVAHNYGIKPVITLNNEVYYSSGTGSLEDPYIIGEKDDNFLNQKHINEFVSFNNQTWKIIDQDSIGTKIMLNGVLEDKRYFDKKTNLYTSSSIYKYLNNDYYNSLENKDMLVKGKFYIGYYNSNNNYDYKSIYENEVEAYVGLPSLNDLYVMDYTGIYTLTPVYDGSKTIYVLSSDNTIYTDRIHINRSVRPVLYLNSNLKVKGGSGSEEDPYVLE